MPQPERCPDPTACHWETRTLDGAQVEVCVRCGRVQLDAAILAQLTGGRVPTADPSDPFAAPVPDPTDAPPVPVRRAAMAPGPSEPRVAPPPPPPAPSLRTAQAITPGAPPRRGLTPGAPPARDPQAARGHLFAETVIPFVGDLRQPSTFDDEDGETLRAAPPPISAGPPGAWPAIDELPGPPNPIDDSRSDTEETSIGPRDNEPAIGLRAAVSRADEPELGLSVDDTNLPHEGQAFLSPRERAVRVSLDHDPDIDPDALDWRPQRRRLPQILFVLAVALMFLGTLTVAGALLLLPLLQGAEELAPAPLPSLAEALPVAEPEPEEPEAEPEPVPRADPAPAPAPAAAPPVQPTPAPAPRASTPAPSAPAEPTAPPPETRRAATTPTAAPAPAPAPATRSAAPTYQRLIDRGWSKVETDASVAADAFREALDARPGDAEASYGLGYAMLKLGQRNGARAYLCAAAGKADAKTATEIRAVLANAALSCE